jgi:hypothetical protein
LSDLLDSPLGNALLQMAMLIPGWSGTPCKLHAKLAEIVGKKVAASADWSKTTGNFGNDIRRLAHQLRLNGVSICFERRHDGRLIILKSERMPIASAGDARANTESSQKVCRIFRMFRLASSLNYCDPDWRRARSSFARIRSIAYLGFAPARPATRPQ